jgi:acetyltransferase
MGLEGLYQMCFPRSVAVWADAQGPGRAILSNLQAGGFNGAVFAVSPAPGEICGLAGFPDFCRIASAVDLAVLAAPAERLPELVADCGRAGVRSAVIPTRLDPAEEAFSACLAPAAAGGVRLLGPRSWGVVSPWSCLNAGLSRVLPPAGELAVISQSRAVCAGLLDFSIGKRIGLSLLVGLGEGLEVDAADLLDYLAGHYRVGAILLHLERIPALRKFMSAARAASRIKPVVVLKTGRRIAPDRPAATATGRLIREDGAYDAAFRRAGLIRVETLEDLFDCGDLAGKQSRPQGPNLAIVGNAHSPGVMAADFLAGHGYAPAAFSPDTSGQLLSVPGVVDALQNPLTLGPTVSPEGYRRVIEICMTAPEVDGLLLILTPHFLSDPAETARVVAAAQARRAMPVFAVWMGDRGGVEERRILAEAGLPVFEGPEQAVRAFLYLYDYDHNLKLLQEIPPRQPERFAGMRAKAEQIIADARRRGVMVLTAMEGLGLLQAYELPTVSGRTAADAAGAAKLADELGYPAILTLMTRRAPVLHRRRLRRKGLHDAGEVAAAYAALLRESHGLGIAGEPPAVLVQPEVVDPDLELRMGFRHLPPFGPVLVFGYGGVREEIPLDQAIGLPPLNRALARRLLEGTRIHRLLRGAGPVTFDCREALEDFLIGLGRLAAELPRIVELEVSPLLVASGRLMAASAAAVLGPAEAPAPLHLIISPYPDHYETTAVTRSGIPIFIRPIKPEDAPLLQALWATLSPRSIYLRFLKTTQELTPELLVRFTQIDYDREVALVALESTPDGNRMLGVSRLLWRPGDDVAEFAVVVGDPWQGMGVGARLLTRLCAIGITRGMKTIWGIVLRENRAMLDLARRLCCLTCRGDDDTEVEVRLDLANVQAPEILEAVREIQF